MMPDSYDQKRLDAVEGLPPLREVIAAYDLRAQKSLGQNFLLDLNITDKIVREAMVCDGAGWCGVHVVEIGPGPGGLTRALLKSPARRVTAIEYDKRAVSALQDLADAVGDDFQVLQQDALRVNALDISAAPRVVVANLTYNIATPLLIGWLNQISVDQGAYQSMALMFQKEVADRIVARPNTKAYGRLSIIAQWLCDVRILYDLPPSAFTPPPKVNSSVVFLKPKVLGDDAPSFEAVERVTAAAFNQRRKMVRSSLRDYMGAIEALGIEPTKRAENLSLSEYLGIAGYSCT